MTVLAELLGEWVVNNDDYHADRSGLSHSALEVFRESHALYHGIYVTGEIPPQKSNRDMQFGTCFHAMLLEPDKASEVCCVEPDVDRRTKAGREKYAEFEAGNNGKIVLVEEEYERLHRMTESVRRNPLARTLLDSPGGQIEQAVRAVHKETGILLKAKADKLYLNSRIAIDLKSAADPKPESFLKAVESYGYHRQVAFYTEAISAAYQLDPPKLDYYFIAVGKQPPYETVVSRLDDESLEWGTRQVRKLLRELRSCIELNIWDQQWSHRIETLRIRPWAKTEV